MATELEINAKINTANSAEGLNSIRKSLKDLVSLQDQVGKGSAGFEKLRSAINETEGRMSELTDSFSTLRGSGVERLNSSFGLLKEGFEGFDSGKLKAGLEGVGSAMGAIPVFLIAEGVKLLIEHFSEIVEFFKELIGSSNSFTKELEEMKKANIDLNNSIDAQITALGGLKENEAEIIKLRREKIALSIEEAKVALRAAILNQKNSEAELTTSEKVFGALSGNLTALQIKRQAGIAQAKEDTKKQTQELENQLAALQGFDNVQIQSAIDKNTKIRDENKKASDEEEKNRIARRDKAIAQDAEDAQIKIARFEEEQAAKEKEKTDAEAEFARITASVQAQADKDYEQLKANNARTLAEHKANEAAKFSIANSAAQGIGLLGNILIRDQEKAIKFNKGVALAQIAIDTAKAISALTAASSANPTNAVTFGAAGIAQFATGIVQILANIAAAKKVLQSGGSVQAPSASTGGGSVGAGATSQAPQQQTLNTQSSLFGGVTPGQQGSVGNASHQQITKVVVLESDITKAVNKVATIESQAKIG